MLESRPLASLLGSQNVGLWRELPQEINTHQTAKINTFITPRCSLQRAATSILHLIGSRDTQGSPTEAAVKLSSNRKRKKKKVTGLSFLNN